MTMTILDLQELLVAVAGNTVSLWSGGIGLLVTAFGLAVRSDERWADRWRLFVGTGLLSLLIAPTAAWIDEHHIAKERFREIAGLRQELADLI